MKKRTISILLILSLCASLFFAMPFAKVKKPARVTGIKTSVTTTTVTIKWKKAKNAKKYVVYQKKGSKWKKVLSTKKRIARIKSLKQGTKYSFRVRGINNKKGKFSKVKTVTTKGIAKTNTTKKATAKKKIYKGELYETEESVSKRLYDGMRKYETSFVMHSTRKIPTGNFFKPLYKYTQYFPVVFTACQDPVDATNQYHAGKMVYRYEIEVCYENSKEEHFKALNKATSIANALKGTNKEKVVQLNDWFCRNCKYDYTYSKCSSYNALIENTSVCDGFAKAASLVLHEAGVDVKYVSGPADGLGGWGAHAWNMVKVNGKWYSCDFTWDVCYSSIQDSPEHGIVSQTWLLKGLNDETFWGKHKLEMSDEWLNKNTMATTNLI